MTRGVTAIGPCQFHKLLFFGGGGCACARARRVRAGDGKRHTCAHTDKETCVCDANANLRRTQPVDVSRDENCICRDDRMQGAQHTLCQD